MITGNLSNITRGTAKSYEHLGSKFAFRVEGDGALEPSISDKFSLEKPAVESLDDRKVREFLKKEAALQSTSAAGRSAEKGSAELQKLTTSVLGEGWKVDSFSAPLGGAPNVLTVELTEGTSRQSISIDRYGRDPKITLGASVVSDGWKIDQTITGDLSTTGAVNADSVEESAYFSKFA